MIFEPIPGTIITFDDPDADESGARMVASFIPGAVEGDGTLVDLMWTDAYGGLWKLTDILVNNPTIVAPLHLAGLDLAPKTAARMGEADAQELIATSEGDTSDWAALGSPLSGSWVDGITADDLLVECAPELRARLEAAEDSSVEPSITDQNARDALCLEYEESFTLTLAREVPLLTDLTDEQLNEGRSVCEPIHEILPQTTTCPFCSLSN
jgi:hypothetical protein